MLATLILLAGTAMGPAQGDQIADFVADYRQDPSAVTAEFGIKVDDQWWTVSATPEGDGTKVSVTTGQPETPTWYFTMDAATLDKLHAGTLNPLTAQAKARQSDVTPMDADFMEGFEPDSDFLPTYLSVSFHFWTRGQPERIPFGPEFTLPTHGSHATVFYYQPGFRSAYFDLRPGDHANEKPEDQVNPFPSLLIPIRGKGKGRIGGQEVDLTEGQAILIPAGVAHELWNPNEASLEAILLMFGEGA